MAEIEGGGALELQTLISTLNNGVVASGNIAKAITQGLSSVFVQTTGQATSANAGAHGDVPAQVDGYQIVNIPGVGLRKIPYYLP